MDTLFVKLLCRTLVYIIQGLPYGKSVMIKKSYMAFWAPPKQKGGLIGLDTFQTVMAIRAPRAMVIKGKIGNRLQ